MIKSQRDGIEKCKLIEDDKGMGIDKILNNSSSRNRGIIIAHPYCIAHIIYNVILMSASALILQHITQHSPHIAWCTHIMSVIRQKGESQNGGNKKAKQAKFSEKRTFLTPWGVRNVLFSKNLACFAFLLPLF